MTMFEYNYQVYQELVKLNQYAVELNGKLDTLTTYSDIYETGFLILVGLISFSILLDIIKRIRGVIKCYKQ